MIRIGLSKLEKEMEIKKYVQQNNIKKVFCFYYKDFPFKYDISCEIEYIEYDDIEMYKFFYRLLEEIDNTSLIIMDECMRTQNRSELIYNCAHHYLNQTPHKIIFEFFPIIENEEDFMILLDFENKGKYKGKSFDYIYLNEEDIQMKPFDIHLETIKVEINEKDTERYEKKKEQLFDTLENKDPNTIPRNLQIFAGTLKKKALNKDVKYVARNKRFKLDNVFTYKTIEANTKYIVIDTHYRRINMNDFIKLTKMNNIKYLTTGLSIDNYIISSFNEWKGRLKNIYAKASLYK
ncbi:hypothetical protein [Clostridium botulinum]|uniref:hypothetical protein n=1 Tax=Clostridium botulinum TaxID=1491 RepID=UPI001E2CFB38|nr:hypothetical protein [Clostridium botulinum]MCD3202825.1 hypothetical protein [Clostridium botulinum C/D]MCD3230887.1 hypothetical protein [Clostridium botulinum C/D]MCD3253927.1 hypothetical protein [Clostridium botulinum C/D]MCD3279477.1 hypothetical protein [Clostridium botulinum C/D]MCD3281630.1 hypothetical protein [Clostridium botulinum C/D]